MEDTHCSLFVRSNTLISSNRSIIPNPVRYNVMGSNPTGVTYLPIVDLIDSLVPREVITNRNTSTSESIA